MGINAAMEQLAPQWGRGAKLPYTHAFRLDFGPKVSLFSGKSIIDPYDLNFRTNATNTYRTLYTNYAEAKSDPFMLGVFLDNEPPFMNGPNGWLDLPTSILNLHADVSAAKRAFINWLKGKYKTNGVADIAVLNAAWGTAFTSWSAMNAPFRISTITAGFDDDCHWMTSLFAEKYAREINQAFRAVDKNHLILGMRLDNFTRRLLDKVKTFTNVVSFNHYGPDIKSPKWDDLRTFDKPLLMGEFHFGSAERGFAPSSLAPTLTDAQRATAYQRFAQSVLDHPAFVGMHWHQYVDFPLSGSEFSSENYRIGFVDVTDTPDPLMVAAARNINSLLYLPFRP
jgi:hypothetical protein